jgi:PBP1b-binding outer membrane lipoprotein LpoB
MNLKSILLVALLVLSSAFAVVGCSSENAGNSKVNDDVELNTPENPKGKGLRKAQEGS